MTTREDVIKGFDAVDARVHEMTSRLVAHADAHLPEGEWHVRQALCHLAARANSVPVAMAAAERARASAPGGSAFSRGTNEIDDTNQRQIDERRHRTMQELLEEIHAGHQAAVKIVRELEGKTLDEQLSIFAGRGQMSFAELLLRAGPGHENSHLDQIEKAIGNQQSISNETSPTVRG